jgi:hypothetical protein
MVFPVLGMPQRKTLVLDAQHLLCISLLHNLHEMKRSGYYGVAVEAAGRKAADHRRQTTVNLMRIGKRVGFNDQVPSEGLISAIFKGLTAHFVIDNAALPCVTQT